MSHTEKPNMSDGLREWLGTDPAPIMEPPPPLPDLLSLVKVEIKGVAVVTRAADKTE